MVKSSRAHASIAARPKGSNIPYHACLNLGVVRTEQSSLVCADVLFLIEGASEGGAAVVALRHIGRTALIVHMVDGTVAIRGGPWGLPRNQRGLKGALQSWLISPSGIVQ